MSFSNVNHIFTTPALPQTPLPYVEHLARRPNAYSTRKGRPSVSIAINTTGGCGGCGHDIRWPRQTDGRRQCSGQAENTATLFHQKEICVDHLLLWHGFSGVCSCGCACVRAGVRVRAGVCTFVRVCLRLWVCVNVCGCV